MKFDSKTSFCTSLAMLSTVPGFGRPRSSLRSAIELYASLIAAATGFPVRMDKEDDTSAIFNTAEIVKVDRRCLSMPCLGTNGNGEIQGTS